LLIDRQDGLTGGQMDGCTNGENPDFADWLVQSTKFLSMFLEM
jgi:hypothetical protein